MPFKSLMSPRQVADLGGEIRASAYLSKPEQVVLLSSDPVQVGALPPSGASCKATAISVSTGDDVALLSRDVAMVRSGDDVWALLDITHSAKMDQVGRDAQRLFARPTGESALSLGWDGRATEYKIQGHEVVAREFVLRGEVKTMDITATETYVAVEGELRVHPGSTPEAGANARAPLPRGTEKLDRLRGGRALSALFKQGDATVCVVVKSGQGLSAKLVHLDAPVSDLAVLEGSMVVACSNGLHLFDAAAIAAGTLSRIEPTFTLDVPGEPSAVQIAGTGASPALFVGTRSGAVVRTSFVRKGG